MGLRKDITGNTYGGWLVLHEVEPRVFPSGQAQRYYLCKCKCGVEKSVMMSSLTRGKTECCGCVIKAKHTKHGHHGTSAYRSWHSMLQRCTNPNNSGYGSYGGSGIDVCDSWRDFSSFFEDMGERPEGSTLDRINGTKGYSKENCRWANLSLQGHNRVTGYGSSKYLGVSFNKASCLWDARISINGQQYTLGLFDSEVDAAKARDKKAEELYGDTARLNFR